MPGAGPYPKNGKHARFARPPSPLFGRDPLRSVSSCNFSLPVHISFALSMGKSTVVTRPAQKDWLLERFPVYCASTNAAYYARGVAEEFLAIFGDERKEEFSPGYLREQDKDVRLPPLLLTYRAQDLLLFSAWSGGSPTGRPTAMGDATRAQ